MLYALIGSGLLGALSTAFLLWRKSIVETKLANAQAIGRAASLAELRTSAELLARQADFAKKLASSDAQIDSLRTQNANLLKALANAPGTVAELIRLQTLPKG